MIDGFDHDLCAKRNRLAARRDGVNAAPVNLLKGAPARSGEGVNVWSRGTLPSTDEEALARINAARGEGAEPLTLEDVYIHYLEAANGNFVADRFMFLDSSTLKNIAADAESGFAFMNSHRTGSLSHPSELPFGRTFAGRYEQHRREGEEAASVQRAVVGFYMLRGARPNGDSGPSTDELHRGIQAGTVFDASVGLWGGEDICDVCGRDIYEFDRDAYEFTCPHVPGTTHQMTPEEIAAQEARGVPGGMASYTLTNARCGEVSAVFDGAVPGAGFRKALSLSRQGALSHKHTKEARSAYAALLGKGDFVMDESEMEKRVEGIFSRVFSKFTNQTPNPPSAPAEPTPAAEPVGERITAQQHPVLTAALGAGIDTPEKLTALQSDAAYKDKYKARLCAEAKRLAVMNNQASLSALIDTYSIEQLEAYVQASGTAVDNAFGISPSGGAKPQTSGTDPAAMAEERPANIVADFTTKMNAERTARKNPLVNGR